MFQCVYVGLSSKFGYIVLKAECMIFFLSFLLRLFVYIVFF